METDAALRGQVARVIVSVALRGLPEYRAGIETLKRIVVAALLKSASIPVLRTVDNATDEIVVLAFLQTRCPTGCGCHGTSQAASVWIVGLYMRQPIGDAIQSSLSWCIRIRARRADSSGFRIFLLSNVPWVCWGWQDGAWALIFPAPCLALKNVRGIRENERP